MRPAATSSATATSKSTSSIKLQRHALRVLNGSFMAINLCMGLYVYHIASTCAATVNDHHASLSAQHLHSKTKPATFRQWLLDYPDTPGATLVRLLQQELHVTRTAEAARLRACRKESLPLVSSLLWRPPECSHCREIGWDQRQCHIGNADSDALIEHDCL